MRFALLGITALAVQGLAVNPLQADDVQILRVINDTHTAVTFQIKSQRPLNSQSPWVVREIPADKSTEIRLVSPDNFIVKVEFQRLVFESKPMPLKKGLAADPQRVLYVSATSGADPRVVEFKPQAILGLTQPRNDQPGPALAQEGARLSDADEASLSQTLDSRSSPRPVLDKLRNRFGR